MRGLLMDGKRNTTMTKATQNLNPSTEDESRATSLLSSMRFLTDSLRQKLQPSVAGAFAHGLISSEESLKELTSYDAETALRRLATAHEGFVKEDRSSEMWEEYRENPELLIADAKEENQLMKELDEQPKTAFVQMLEDQLNNGGRG
jgi:hypothetical protein